MGEGGWGAELAAPWPHRYNPKPELALLHHTVQDNARQVRQNALSVSTGMQRELEPFRASRSARRGGTLNELQRKRREGMLPHETLALGKGMHSLSHRCEHRAAHTRPRPGSGPQPPTARPTGEWRRRRPGCD